MRFIAQLPSPVGDGLGGDCRLLLCNSFRCFKLFASTALNLLLLLLHCSSDCLHAVPVGSYYWSPSLTWFMSLQWLMDLTGKYHYAIYYWGQGRCFPGHRTRLIQSVQCSCQATGEKQIRNKNMVKKPTAQIVCTMCQNIAFVMKINPTAYRKTSCLQQNITVYDVIFQCTFLFTSCIMMNRYRLMIHYFGSLFTWKSDIKWLFLYSIPLRLSLAG